MTLLGRVWTSERDPATRRTRSDAPHVHKTRAISRGFDRERCPFGRARHPASASAAPTHPLSGLSLRSLLLDAISQLNLRASPPNMVTCTHKGCGKDFDPENNAPDSCTYHPGAPVFHEGLKSWSCCQSVNKPVLDFDEFMQIPVSVPQ